MAHFYGTVQGNRGEASRCGNKVDGIVAHVAGWGGAVCVNLYHRNGEDRYEVSLVPWQGKGQHAVIAEGKVGDLPVGSK